MKNLDTLKMKIRKYATEVIFEFDTLDELREFDESYRYDTRSVILKNIAKELKCREEDIVSVTSFKDKDNTAVGINFEACGGKYTYHYETQKLRRIS